MERFNNKKDDTNMVFGVHPVEELIKSGKELEKVFVQSGLRSAQISEIVKYARDREVPVQFVPAEKLNRLTRKNHQGIVACVCPISYQTIEEVVPMAYESGKMPFVVILDRVTDVRNFGAIARTCYAAGVDAIVIPARGSALINADAMKTSAGALSLINVCRVNNIKDTIDFLKASGLSVVAFSEKGRQRIWDADLSGPIALIMGSEEDGISESYLKRADKHLVIPMPGDIDSLNVGVATGIAAFEVVRQRMGE
ncbi:MAG: 23S rRNA (guanosine(2251)-2'-O)-methyltransferase RlmB [Candidatus Limimorpha sp.]